MRYDVKQTTPTLGDRYRSSEWKEFEIIATRLVENDPWVEYRNVETSQEYSCRTEAFLARFSPSVRQ